MPNFVFWLFFSFPSIQPQSHLMVCTWSLLIAVWLDDVWFDWVNFVIARKWNWPKGKSSTFCFCFHWFLVVVSFSQFYFFSANQNHVDQTVNLISKWYLLRQKYQPEQLLMMEEKGERILKHKHDLYNVNLNLIKNTYVFLCTREKKHQRFVFRTLSPLFDLQRSSSNGIGIV